jgi:hypothetical protein
MRPTVGNQPSRTAKMYFRITARKKIGIEIPINDPIRLRLSKIPPCLFAARNPSGKPMPIATIIAATASSIVAGKRFPISDVIVRCDAMLVPRSPSSVVFR